MIGARATASLVTLAGAIAAIVIGVRIVLRLPGIPYNVRGLFLDDASVPTLVFFALALMWFGGGAALGAFVVTSTRRGFLAFPVVMTALALISKLLVSRSVTYESLDDVLGSVNLYGLVVQSGAWGPWWQDTFRTIGADTVDFVERRVRYCALYSIPVTPMVLAIIPTLRRRAVGLRDALLLLGVAAAWFLLCGAIVLRWAATDNLTELVAGSGPFGLPGPLFLAALAVLFAANVAFVVRGTASIRTLAVAIASTVAAGAAGWVLLNAGLEQHVEKYNLVFPATQFLLGPDRQHTLGTATLFARWMVVYVALVAVASTGAWIAAGVLGDRRT